MRGAGERLERCRAREWMERCSAREWMEKRGAREPPCRPGARMTVGGLRITALGTGDALFGAGRGSTAWLVDDSQGTYVVDFGPTAMLALRKLGRDPLDLDTVYITHLHGDHFAGWPFLLLDARLRRTRPLAVVGPPGTRERLAALWAVCYADTAKKPLPFALEVHEISPAAEEPRSPPSAEPGARAAGLRPLAVFRAQHMSEPHLALSFRIGPIAFSGDTARLPDGLCDGARILCCECTCAIPGKEKHLDWLWLASAPLPVERVLVGHLGKEARAVANSVGKLHICDDLETFSL